MKNSDIQIIDNFLPDSFHLYVRNLLFSTKFPWYYTDNLSYGNETEMLNRWLKSDPKIKDTFGFTHIARDQLDVDSPYFELLKPIAYFLEERLQETVNNVYRLRAVMTCKDQTFGNYYNVPHVDIPQPHRTMVYYVNDSDGDTVIFKERWFGKNDYSVKNIETTVTPKANRAVIFDGLRYHTGSVPTGNNRVLININFD
jgi:hypothetical protein